MKYKYEYCLIVNRISSSTSRNGEQHQESIDNKVYLDEESNKENLVELDDINISLVDGTSKSNQSSWSPDK